MLAEHPIARGHGVDDDRTIGTVDNANLEEVPARVKTDGHGQPLVELFDTDRVVERNRVTCASNHCA